MGSNNSKRSPPPEPPPPKSRLGRRASPKKCQASLSCLSRKIQPELSSCESCGGQISELEKVDFGCIHVYCLHCVKKEFTDLIQQGNAALKCPHPNCNVPALWILVQRVVDRPIFMKYDGLRGRNRPPNGEKSCPRCKKEAETNPEHFYGICEECGYNFCTNCNKDYHGFERGCRESEMEDPDIDFEFGTDPESKFMTQLQEFMKFQKETLELEKLQPENEERVFECNICMDKHKTSLAIRFGCYHRFCNKCIKTYFENKVKEGRSHGFRCPALECGVEADYGLVKRVLDAKTFERYDQILLDETIAREMPEVVTCPMLKCQRRVVAEPEFGFCSHCDYRFCTGCSRAYHGLSPCVMTEEERLKEIRKLNALGGAERVKLERQLEAAHNRPNESDLLIKKVCRKCPTCRSNIEKDFGCYHMQCANCGTHFCWLCLTRLDQRDLYSHFTSVATTCALFEDQRPRGPARLTR